MTQWPKPLTGSWPGVTAFSAAQYHSSEKVFSAFLHLLWQIVNLVHFRDFLKLFGVISLPVKRFPVGWNVVLSEEAVKVTDP